MSEKTEAPTPRRIEDARAEGRVARSQELGAAAGLLAGAWLLQGSGGRLVGEFKDLITYSLISLPEIDRSIDYSWFELKSTLVSDLLRLAPGFSMILAGLLFTGLAVNFGQTGFLWANKRLGFKFDRLNPLSGLKRLFSLNGLVELVKSLLKLLIVGWVAYAFLHKHAIDMLTLSQIDFDTALWQWVDLSMSLMLRVGAAYLVLALADYGYQRWQYMQSLRMTKDEVKEDFKRSEGDPFIRSRIRGQQRRMARMRMMANVHKADVVITNPTHLAIAIQYKANEMSAPKVLAKGADRIAERIVELARASLVPVVQNIPVAHALFRAVDVDEQIPPELYAAMAEVLAYVYRQRGQVFKPS